MRHRLAGMPTRNSALLETETAQSVLPRQMQLSTVAPCQLNATSKPQGQAASTERPEESSVRLHAVQPRRIPEHSGAERFEPPVVASHVVDESNACTRNSGQQNGVTRQHFPRQSQPN